ncbi:MAG: AsmA family protein [Sphingomonadaceae bacterium]
MLDQPERASQPAVDRSRGLRIVKWAVIGLLALIVLIWAILFVTKGSFLKGSFETIASRITQREVRVAGDFQLYFNPINVQFRAGGLTVSNPGWATRRNFFESRLIDSRISLLSLLFADKKRINRLLLDRGHIDLEWDNQGRRNSWTFGDPDAKGEPLDLPLIRRAAVTGTTLRYRDPPMQLTTDIKFDTIRAANTQVAGGDVRFDGSGNLRERPFTLTGSLLSPNETVAGGRNRFQFDARAARDRLQVSGTLSGMTELEGADLAVKVRGANLARLFDFLGVVVPDTRSYHFTSQLTRTGDAWRFRRLKGAFGESDLAGEMTVSQPNNRLRIDANLKSRSVDIVDVGPFVGYDVSRLAEQGKAGAVTRVAGTPRVLPDAQLRVDALKSFDAHVDYAVRDVRAPNLPVSNIALTLDLDNSLLKLSPLTMGMSRGHLASDIIIDARQRPVVTDYDIRLAPTPMGTLLAGWGVAQSGTSGVVKARVKLRGVGDTVHDSLAASDGRIAIILPRGTMWTQNVQLSELDIGTFITKMFADKLKKPVEINCGLIAFTVRNGIAAADPILIDTSKNVITGRGNFSFRDESLNLALRADGKKFSLISGQSPVGINGYFASPGLQVITPELLTRAGAAAGTALVASPLAAVIAFIDPGDAKATACGPVLNGARAVAQRTTKGEPRKDVGSGSAKKS